MKKNKFPDELKRFDGGEGAESAEETSEETTSEEAPGASDRAE